MCALIALIPAVFLFLLGLNGGFNLVSGTPDCVRKGLLIVRFVSKN